MSRLLAGCLETILEREKKNSPANGKMNFESAKSAVVALSGWNIVHEDFRSFEKALARVDKVPHVVLGCLYRECVHSCRCQKLYGEDLNQIQTIEGARIVNTVSLITRYLGTPIAG